MKRVKKSKTTVEARTLEQTLRKIECEEDPLYFTRYFFKCRQEIKFLVNWHHRYLSDVLQEVIDGKRKNVVINVPPGSSKTEMAVINFIARGLALNPRARFLHLSYSDDLALLNSQSARDMITSQEFQDLWPLKIAEDAKSKKRWNVLVNGKSAGGVYAVSLGGQVTGFRAGRMTTGFQGAIIIDDPLKPDDAFSETKLKAANRKLLTTVKSRKANPETPIIVIMQRISQSDPTEFIKKGNLNQKFDHVVIPAILTNEKLKDIPEKYHSMIDRSVRDKDGRFSYWQYKEPIEDLGKMERGESEDKEGSKISRMVYSAQYDQNPVPIGGNLLKGKDFIRYKVLPKIKYRKIFCDTAQKTAERNDFSVFECWGLGDDGRIYLLDLIRDKWEAPELKKRALAFWSKHKALDSPEMGTLRQMVVEDKSSGTGLIQEIKLLNFVPVVGLERVKDKLTRVMDGQPYIEGGMVAIPEMAPWVHDFVKECEAFTADDTHDHDDQIDPLLDAIVDMLSSGNKLKAWENVI